ncbi:MAG: GDP-mannose 4,6-dehydratase, partial [Cyclobacteriaceae bacterium]|nr:GDP-mannose 4,6-dehydratase [Cyclobacteriaceae bacterium]
GILAGVDKARYQSKVGEMNGSLQALMGKEIIKVDPKYFRPTEVDLLIGDPSKSMTKLGWKPEYDLKALIADMMQSDIQLFKQDEYLLKGGFKTLNYFE